MKAIEFNDVELEYSSVDKQKIKAVDGVSFSVEEGQFVALVGHNGSGKSTLAKLMNGLLLPTKGSVKVFEYDTADKETIFEVRKRVGMVFQNPDNQMIASIVEDDIAFGPENLGLPREEIRERVDWALEKVGMAAHKKSTPFKMSGGQKQRLAIAGILAIKPRVLVLDESTAMLDPKGRREVLNVVRELNEKEKITVILITHYMDEAIGADRVIVMNKGRIFADGNPREIFSRPDMLKDANLTLPLSTAIAESINRAGGALEGIIITEEELVEELCRRLK